MKRQVKKSTRINKGNRNLKAALSQSGWAAAKTKNTFLRAKYNSMVGRKGKKKTIIVLAHKILIAAYHILSKREKYHELGSAFLEQRLKNNRIKYLKNQLHELGLEEVAKQVA
jgi:transposase